MLKITVNRDALLYHLDVVSKALGKTDIYSGVAITFDSLNPTVTLSATNGDIFITSLIPEVKIEGKPETGILLNGRLLLEIVKKLNDRYIDIDVSDKVLIKAGKSKFTLNLMDIDRFPFRQAWAPTVSVTMVGLDFKNLVKKTIIAASTSETRLTLQGINFKAKNNQLIASATDSFRIATDTVNIDSGKEIDVIIPAASLNELIKIMRDSEVIIGLNESYAKFEFGSSVFETRLISGAFPDVNKFFPTSFLITKIVNRQSLISALERASILLETNSSQVVKIEFEPNLATISTAHNEFGQAREEVLTSGYTDNITIAMSHKYLTDALKTFTVDDVEINITGETSPLVIIAKDLKETLKQLILPVRM